MTERELQAAREAQDLWETVREDLASGSLLDVEQWVQNDRALQPISEALTALVETLEDQANA